MLHEPLTESQREAMVQWLASGSVRIEKWDKGWHFWIHDGGFLGLPETSDKNSGRPLHLEIEEFLSARPTAPEFVAYLVEEERAAVRACLGFVPIQEISLSAWCNDRFDHRLLGYLTLTMAERFGGLINMRGAITPPIPRERSMRAKKYPWCTLEEISAYVRQMPGRIWEIPYETGSGRNWVYHIVDSAFLRTWLRHPNFHMIK